MRLAVPLGYPVALREPVSVKLSNRSAARRNGNWKLARRDWRRKHSNTGPKISKFSSRDSGALAYLAGMSAVLTHAEIAPQGPNCLAEDAGGLEPVSLLITGKNTGKIGKTGPEISTTSSPNAASMRVFSGIP